MMNKGGHFRTVAYCMLGGGIMFSVPFYFRWNTKSLERKSGALTGSQRQRGMYLNAGSQDAGPDPDWDPKDHKWKGHREPSTNTHVGDISALFEHDIDESANKSDGSGSR